MKKKIVFSVAVLFVFGSGFLGGAFYMTRKPVHALGYRQVAQEDRGRRLLFTIEWWEDANGTWEPVYHLCLPNLVAKTIQPEFLGDGLENPLYDGPADSPPMVAPKPIQPEYLPDGSENHLYRGPKDPLPPAPKPIRPETRPEDAIVLKGTRA